MDVELAPERGVEAVIGGGAEIVGVGEKCLPASCLIELGSSSFLSCFGTSWSDPVVSIRGATTRVPAALFSTFLLSLSRCSCESFSLTGMLGGKPNRGTETGAKGGGALFGILAPTSRRPLLQGPDGGPDEGVGGWLGCREGWHC